MTATVVDTSAIVALVFDEAEGDRITELMLRRSGDLVMSAANLNELLIVLGGRQGDEAVDAAERLIDEFGIEIAAVGDRQARGAYEAWRTFGRGRHPAGLNYGDCFAYALAAELDAELLYKGDDFSKTGARSAL